MLKEWVGGLKKVSATKLLQDKAGLSLVSAKSCVDRLLDGETVSVSLPTIEQAKSIAADLNKLGVRCEVSDDR